MQSGGTIVGTTMNKDVYECMCVCCKKKKVVCLMVRKWRNLSGKVEFCLVSWFPSLCCTEAEDSSDLNSERSGFSRGDEGGMERRDREPCTMTTAHGRDIATLPLLALPLLPKLLQGVPLSLCANTDWPHMCR